jgi:hypothetical protein
MAPGRNDADDGCHRIVGTSVIAPSRVMAMA